MCARVLLAFETRATFWVSFLKISLGPPFALFLKLQVLGDLPKNCHSLAIRARFEALFALKSSPVFAL